MPLVRSVILSTDSTRTKTINPMFTTPASAARTENSCPRRWLRTRTWRLVTSVASRWGSQPSISRFTAATSVTRDTIWLELKIHRCRISTGELLVLSVLLCVWHVTQISIVPNAAQPELRSLQLGGEVMEASIATTSLVTSASTLGRWPCSPFFFASSPTKQGAARPRILKESTSPRTSNRTMSTLETSWVQEGMHKPLNSQFNLSIRSLPTISHSNKLRLLLNLGSQSRRLINDWM